MSRGVGAIEPIQNVIPDWGAVIVATLTQLGDGWFLLTLLGVLYWTQADDQDEVLLVGGLLVAGVGLYRGLKYSFELPRPDQSLIDPAVLLSVVEPFYEATAHASGYGFPSGHATSSAIVYFGLAAVLPVETRRTRFGVAALLVGTVSLTRVALGVHFLVDVVVGVVLGGAVVLVGVMALDRVTAKRVTPVLGTAVVLNGFYVLTSDGTATAVAVLGGAVGLFGGWQLVLYTRELAEATPDTETVRLRLGLGAVALVGLGLALVTSPLLSTATTPIVGGSILGFAVAIGVVVPIARHNPETWTHTFGVLQQHLHSKHG